MNLVLFPRVCLADSVLGQIESFTLVDSIHVVAMVLIFTASFIAIVTRALYQRDWEAAAVRIDKIAFVLSSAGYVAANVWVFAAAAFAG
jgi:hypothetical protein